MKHTKYVVGLALLIGCLVSAAGLSIGSAGPATATRPATRAVASATSPATSQSRPTRPEDILAKGIEHAFAGKFHQAIKAVRAVAKAAPDNATAAAALELLEAHVARETRNRTERAREYAEAVQRVQLGMLAKQHMPKLTEAKIDKKLRKTISAVVSAYERIGSGERLENTDTKSAEQLRTAAVKALDSTHKSLGPVLKVVKGDKSRYAKALGQLVEALRQRLTDCRKVWHVAKIDSPAGRSEAAGKLEPVEDELALAAADLEAMIAVKPWRIALAHAVQAKELGKERKYNHEQWYKSLLAETEALATKALAEARWYDALIAYSALEELVSGTDGEKEQLYKDKAKAARKHVRVLRFYGNGDDDPATAGSKKKPPKEIQTTWKEMTAGIDATMVKKAVEKLNDSYVTTVDYKKLMRGALLSVRILAETPQASKSFPLLADKERREKFVKAIEEQLAVTKEDNVVVNQVGLASALESVLNASDKTVEIPTEVLSMEFADGLLDELDTFSSMIWPDDVPDFRKHTMGQFFGVGIQITKEPGGPLKVVTPLSGTPAFRAGVKAGDTIVAVDGRATEDLSVDKLVRMITGKKGTKVVLTITRPGLIKPIDKAIIRDEIHIRTVKGWRRIGNGEWNYWLDPTNKIGYVRITQFTDTTGKDLIDVLAEMRKAGMASLVLDARFNPGGLLRAATKVADQFLAEGRIVSTKGRQIRGTEVKASHSGDFLEGGLVVLVNQHSASAAEIVAGAVKDSKPKRGLIVGRRTFGKGSVQNVIPIRERRAYLKLTTGYYYLPSGRLIHRRNGATDWGVVPDVEVGVTPRQMKRWLDIRRKTDLLKDVDQKLLQQTLAKQYDADLQLNTAVLLLKLQRLQT